jgi:light-harvesting protein B-800-850 alpha chain
MNQGRIWCVVNPTVGLPLFLGSVAITSLVVHASVMTHTTWMSTYWQGAKAKTASNGDMPHVASFAVQPGYTVSVLPVTDMNGAAQASFVVTLAPTTVTPAKPDKTGALDTKPPVGAAPFKAASTQ